MIEAGQLIITLHCSAATIQHVSIQSTRPLHIRRLFIGKTPEQTLTILPLLFNVCGVAQSFAAFTALSQALGREENPAATLARQLLLNVEMVREHCWWLLIQHDKAKLAPFIQMVKQFKSALFVNGDAFSLTSQLQVDDVLLESLINELKQKLDEIFLGQRLSWLALQDEKELLRWVKNNPSIPALLLQDLLSNHAQNLGRTALNLLPELPDSELHQQLSLVSADDFMRTPTWQSKPYETSCLNRQQQQPLIANLLQQYGNGLLTRLASRICELANLPNVLRQNFILSFPRSSVGMQPGTLCVPCWSNTGLIPPLERGNDNVGLAQIQASRGLLIHRVELKHGVIANYQIVAPTEWNFHPQGIAASSLQQLSASNEAQLRKQATQLINAIDPCVEFELIIN